MSEPVIDARSIAKSYVSGTRRVDVLDGLDFDVRAGEAVAIIGDSGVGKSTLLHVLGGLDRPDRGSVRHRGDDVYDRGVESLAAYRNRHVGFVFQFHYLLPEFTAFENVVMPFRVGRRPLAEARERAGDLLGRLGLADRLHHHPSELSGGEQQRVAIARAVATGPGVLLADEPTGNLDPGTGARVFGMLREIQAQEGFALVLATHSGRLAGGCERILRLEDGRLRGVTDAEIRSYFDGVPG